MFHTGREALDEGWRFQLDGAAWAEVALPHSWNACDTMEPQDGQWYRRGVGRYERSLTAPPLSLGGRLWLEVGAAAMAAEVFADGKLVGAHVGGYTAFTVELPAVPRLELAISVDNRPDPQRIPSERADFFHYGGLTRPIWLYVTGPARIASLRCDYELGVAAARLRLRGELDGPTPPALRLELSLHGPAGALVVAAALPVAGRHFAGELPPVPEPWRWSPEEPALYTFSARLLDGDTLWDEVSERIGFRDFAWPAGALPRLNGAPIRLRGTHRHEEWAAHGAAVPAALTRQEFALIRAAGFNFVRLGHNPQSEAALDACDELGLLVWEELPWCRGGVGGERFRAGARAQLAEMIAQHASRPSVIFWGLGNELDWEADHAGSSDAEVLAFLRELHALARKLDPARLTALRRFEPGAAVVDVYAPSIWSGWYAGRYEEYAAALAAALPRYPRMLHIEWGGDSHAGRHSEGPHLATPLAAGDDHAELPGLALSAEGPPRASRDGDWSESYILDLFEWHLQVQAATPGLAGAAQWIFKDFGTPLRPENPIPYVNQKGLVDRACRPKEAYFLFKAYLGDEAVCRVESPTWPARAGQVGEPQRVRVYANCAEVELLVNGHSAGSRWRDPWAFPAAGLVWWVALAEGPNELRAVGRMADGQQVEHVIRQTYAAGAPGPAARLEGYVAPTEHPGGAVVRCEVQLVDTAGRPLVADRRRVRFAVSGAAGLLSGCGTPDGSALIELANGRAAILVRLDGAAWLRAEVEGVAPLELAIHNL